MLCSFFKSFFSLFFRLENLYWFIFKLTNSFPVISILLLSTFAEPFISEIVFFSSKISISFLIVHTSNKFCIFIKFILWNIILIAALKSLIILMFMSSWNWHLLIIFPLKTGHIFLILCISSILDYILNIMFWVLLKSSRGCWLFFLSGNSTSLGSDLNSVSSSMGMVLRSVQFSKPWLCCFGSIPCMHHSDVSVQLGWKFILWFSSQNLRLLSVPCLCISGMSPGLAPVYI